MVFAWIANACALLFVVRACIHLVRQRRRRSGRPRELMVSPLAGLAMGAMFLGLQEIVQPEVRHMMVEEMKEQSVNDENGEPMGGRMFWEQLRRIRGGEEVEELTVMVKSE